MIKVRRLLSFTLFEWEDQDRFVNTFQRPLLKAKREGETEEVIRKFQLTYRMIPHPMLGGKTPAGLLMGKTIRTISHAMIPKNKINEPAKSHKRGGFTVSFLVFTRNFRINYPLTAGIVVKRWGKVIYEIHVDDAIWIRHKNQLRPSTAGSKSTPASIPLSFLLDTFKPPACNSNKARQRIPEQQICCPKRTRWKLKRLQMNPKLKSYEQLKKEKMKKVKAYNLLDDFSWRH